jgi:hypothetical protein
MPFLKKLGSENRFKSKGRVPSKKARKDVKEEFEDEERPEAESFQPTHLEINEAEDGDGNNWKKKKKSGGFQSMGLTHLILKGIMKRGYKVPTPIQRKVDTMRTIFTGFPHFNVYSYQITRKSHLFKFDVKYISLKDFSGRCRRRQTIIGQIIIVKHI